MVTVEKSKTIDVLKGIGILFVLLGHNNFDPFIIQTIFTFHIPLFFIVAGYLYNHEKHKQASFTFVVQKIKRLVIPYFTANKIILITLVILSEFKLYTFTYNSPEASVIGVLYGNGAPLAYPNIFTNFIDMPSWFLLSLFSGLLILYVIASIHEEHGIYKSLPLSMMLILLGIVVSRYIFLPWGFDIACVAMTFMFFGYLMKRSTIDILSFQRARMIMIPVAVILFFSVVILNGRVDMNTREYANPILFSLGGILGTYLCLEIAKEVSKYEKLTAIFSYLGVNSIIIMLFHTFVPALFVGLVSRYFDLKEILFNFPLLGVVNMVIFCILTIEIVKRMPFLKHLL